MAQGPVQTTYSFKDLAGVLNNPVLSASFPIVGGNIGNGTLTIRMLTQRTEFETAADGTVMGSYISGQSGEVIIEMQQTSALHHALLSLYNQLVTQAEAGNVANWLSTVLRFRTVLDGSVHTLAGVAFQKIPDKPYATKGQDVTWTLMAASVVNQ
jgi:hypothetical protein